jgi:homoserine O-succinyltransferase/O-acetyltransferase
MSAPETPAVDVRPVRVALVNNMPDAAFVDTEDQFRRATAPGPGEPPIDLELYTLPGITRSESTVAVIRSRYQGLDQLWTTAPDALIITGTEPAQAQLPYEPYWPYLARLLEWAAESVPTTMLSCLAAHASVLLFDGIERVPRQVKCSGVYAGTVDDTSDPLADGLPELVPVPHSRVNDVPEAALLDAGYGVLIGSGSEGSGWSVATRSYGERLFVLCQGHPEYSTESLLREYRRDVRRFLFGRGAVAYPTIPHGYVGEAGTATLEEFAQRAAAPGADPRVLWESFPYQQVLAGLDNTWSAAAATLYANWLGQAHAGLPASGQVQG